MNKTRNAVLVGACLAVAVALVAAGLSQGAFADVWRRAAMVCYECIGIG